MPQTKEVHREYMRNRRKGSQEGSQIILPSGGLLTPALLNALVDKGKREILGKVYESLKTFNQAEGLRYGINGPTFTDMGELLDATKVHK